MLAVHFDNRVLSKLRIQFKNRCRLGRDLIYESYTCQFGEEAASRTGCGGKLYIRWAYLAEDFVELSADGFYGSAFGSAVIAPDKIEVLIEYDNVAAGGANIDAEVNALAAA